MKVVIKLFLIIIGVGLVETQVISELDAKEVLVSNQEIDRNYMGRQLQKIVVEEIAKQKGGYARLKCSLSDAIREILNEEFVDARKHLEFCNDVLNKGATDDRDKEIQIVRKVGLITALLHLVTDTEIGFVSKDYCKAAARSVQAILDGKQRLALDIITNLFANIWVNMGRTVQGNLNKKLSSNVKDIQEAFCSSLCCGGYAKYGVTGPHPSLIYIANHVLTTVRLVGDGYKQKTCIPDLSENYIALNSKAFIDSKRTSIIGYYYIDSALIRMNDAPYMSKEIEEFSIPASIEGSKLKKRINSKRWNEYKIAFDNLHNAMTSYAGPKRYKALCLRLSLEAGIEMLHYWRIDETEYFAGRFVNRDSLKELIMEYQSRLKKTYDLDVAGPAGFGVGFVHGLTSPIRVLGLFGMEFAYPIGAAAWGIAYSIGVILGSGLIVFVFIGVKSLVMSSY